MRPTKKLRGDATAFVRGVDRRNFLRRLGATSAAAAVTARALSAHGPNTSGGLMNANAMLEQLNHASFAPYVGTRFDARIGEGVTPFELVEVRQHSAESNRPASLARREPFSLTFRAPSGTSAPQKIYQMQHASLGHFGIFLVPIGIDARGALYEAVFN